jgi:hypothetical protein
MLKIPIDIALVIAQIASQKRAASFASKLLSVRTMDFHGKGRGGNIKRTRPLSIPSSSPRASIISRSTIAFEPPPSDGDEPCDNYDKAERDAQPS